VHWSPILEQVGMLVFVRRQRYRRGLRIVKTEKRVDLKGSLKSTTSSAQIKSDGSLVIELYDFSSEAEKWLGNEVAFLLKVFPRDKSKMLSCLLEGQKRMLDESQEDDLLLQLIGERFTDYYDVKQWMEENKIPYEKEFDPWA
jgi:hypothetical protein